LRIRSVSSGIRIGSASLGSCTTPNMLASRKVKIRYNQGAAEFKMDSNAVKKCSNERT
jgi:hypothetical protein